MIPRLVWRSLVRRPGRSVLLLAGYALGVGVTVALLSIGSALLEQARDRELVGGGDLTVLPAGLDLETFKTGGVSSLYFTVEQAPFLYRQVLAGPRLRDQVAAAAPWMDDELVYLGRAGGDGARRPASGLTAASAGGRVPSLSRELGVRAEVVTGRWADVASDRDWREPGDSTLYAGLDAFHLPSGPAAGDTTWAEWHYFNVLLPEQRGWLYLTYMVAGAVPDGRWGGRLLATLVEPAGDDRARHPAEGAAAAQDAPGPGRRAPPGPMRVRVYETDVPARRVIFSLARPDLRMGDASVALDSAGVYHLEAAIPPAGDRAGPALRVRLALRAASRQHLPPLEVAGGSFASGYTAPVLDGRASGRICSGGLCRDVRDARAYHDHNWGVWRAVTWDWGHAHLGGRSVLYGGVRREASLLPARPRGGDTEGHADGAPGAPDVRPAPGGRFLFLSDTLGFLGLLPVRSLHHRWSGPAGAAPPTGPEAVRLLAARPPDSVWLDVSVRHVRVSEPFATAGGPAASPPASAAGPAGTDPPRLGAFFYQMQGEARLRARLGGRTVRGSGPGFFETWRVVADSAGPGRREGGP